MMFEGMIRKILNKVDLIINENNYPKIIIPFNEIQRYKEDLYMNLVHEF